MIKVSLYATFRLIAGVKSLDLDLPPGTQLMPAVREIVEKIPALRTHWLDAAGELYPHVHVFVNGTDFATIPSGLDTTLSAGDTLDFFPPVAGGSHH